MKRAYLRKVKPNVSSPSSVDGSPDSTVNQPEQGSRGVLRRARTSAAMVGLALSMGATGLVLPRQSDGAAAAESSGSGATLSPVPQAAPTASEESNPGIAVAPAAVQPEVSPVQHTVAAGETLHGIARKYQITVTAIAQANKLSTRSILQVGQVLKVPARVGSQSVTASPTAEASVPEKTAIDSLQQDREQALSRLRLQREQLQSKLSQLRSENGVQPSSAAIAQEQHASIAELPPAEQAVAQISPAQPEIKQDAALAPSIPQPQSAEAAQGVPQQDVPGRLLQPDWIRSSQNLLTPTSPTAAEPGAPDNLLALRQVTPVTQPTIPQVTSELTTYRVNPGDTVAEIAALYNVPQSLLISANRLSDPNIIFVGQVLRVPGGQTLTAPATAESTAEPKTLPVTEAQLPAQLEAQVPTQIASIALPTQPQTNPTPEAVAVTVPTIAAAEPSVTTPMLPQQVAVAPFSTTTETPATSDLTLPAAPSEAGTAVDNVANPFVQNLLTEIRTLRQQYQQRSETPQVQAVQPVVVPAEPAAIAAASPSGSMAINPQFQRRTNRAVEVSTPEVSTPASLPSQPQTVAVAPLGSENYQPLLRPITGRMVSPDLPPLPGADSFLPNQREVFDGYIWPARGLLTSGYGWRWGRMHRGIDIAADIGTPIYAAADGVIEFAGWNAGGYGNMIEIRHADGSMTRYAHLNRISVRSGQRIEQSQQIGEMGSTGYSTGPHLHFEVHLASQGTVNPISYLPRR